MQQMNLHDHFTSTNQKLAELTSEVSKILIPPLGGPQQGDTRSV